MWNGNPRQVWWPPAGNMYMPPPDPSASWAAAAALWVQQKQLREQYASYGSPSVVRPNLPPPPEPPGYPNNLLAPRPPPPPLPPPADVAPLRNGAEHLPEEPVTVHDYQHGKAPEIVDYQHGKSEAPATAETGALDVISRQADAQSYNQQWNSSAGWNQPQDPPSFAEGWDVQGDSGFAPGGAQDLWPGYQEPQNDRLEYQNWNEEEFEPQQQDMVAKPKSFPHHPSGFHVLHDMASHIPFPSPPVLLRPGLPDQKLLMSEAEAAKKAKGLPQWLRDGLERMEKEKKRQEDKLKHKDTTTLPNAKEISGYQHHIEEHSPPQSPAEKNDSDHEEAAVQEKLPEPDQEPVRELRTRRDSGRDSDTDKKRRRRRFSPSSQDPVQPQPTSQVAQQPAADGDPESDREMDEEERQKQLMLKIKRWMTEVLLGVTNEELTKLCQEVYFEMKRSAKARAQQLRTSGGLEALRSSLGLVDDDDDASSSNESEIGNRKEEAPSTDPIPQRQVEGPALPSGKAEQHALTRGHVTEYDIRQLERARRRAEVDDSTAMRTERKQPRKVDPPVHLEDSGDSSEAVGVRREKLREWKTKLEAEDLERKSSEEARLVAEQARKVAGDTRKSADEARKSAEVVRKSTTAGKLNDPLSQGQASSTFSPIEKSKSKSESKSNSSRKRQPSASPEFRKRTSSSSSSSDEINSDGRGVRKRDESASDESESAESESESDRDSRKIRKSRKKKKLVSRSVSRSPDVKKRKKKRRNSSRSDESSDRGSKPKTKSRKRRADSSDDTSGDENCSRDSRKHSSKSVKSKGKKKESKRKARSVSRSPTRVAKRKKR